MEKILAFVCFYVQKANFPQELNTKVIRNQLKKIVTNIFLWEKLLRFLPLCERSNNLAPFHTI
jgi:hypothetical protein